jgi:hypothetical protein
MGTSYAGNTAGDYYMTGDSLPVDDVAGEAG